MRRGPSVTDMNLQTILAQLHSQHGPLMGGDALRKALAYSSPEAFRLAVMRGKCPIPVFTIENRRGRFALVQDVAAWLDKQQRAAERAAQQRKPGKEET